MAVYSVVAYQVKPGCREEFIESARKAKSLIEKLAVGLRGIRLSTDTISGTNSGRYILRFIYDDLESWAATLAREDADPAFNEMLRKNMGPEAPATMAGRTLVRDIIEPEYGPIGDTPGTVIQLASGRVKPGRLEEAMKVMKESNQHVLDSGALSVRTVMNIVGGPNTGNVATVREYADMTAFGAAWTKRAADPAWATQIDKIVGSDGPIIVESQWLSTEIQL